MPQAEIKFFERKFPSCNMVLVLDERPIVVDAGFGSDALLTKQLLEPYVNPADISMIVNTHYHTDHSGGNHFFQQHYGTKIAAHKWDAKMINAFDFESGASDYLDQKLEPYHVDVLLDDGDEVDTGEKKFLVFHIPGHTLGHIVLYEPTDQVLIVGDLFHRDDVGWLNIFREGVGAIHRSIESIERLTKLPVKIAYSGHGPEIRNPKHSMERAIERFNRWIENPESIGWHGLKRIFAYKLMLIDGMDKKDIPQYLLSSSWFIDISKHLFRKNPEQFITPFLNEMIRSKAATWHGSVLKATAPYIAPDQKWIDEDVKPIDWSDKRHGGKKRGKWNED